jgi:hypothetical protein
MSIICAIVSTLQRHTREPCLTSMTSWSWNAKYTDSKRAEILVLGPGLLGFNLCDTRLHPLANYFLEHQRIEPEADWEVPEFGLSGCTTDTFPPFTTRNPRGVSQ